MTTASVRTEGDILSGTTAGSGMPEKAKRTAALGIAASESPVPLDKRGRAIFKLAQ